MDFALDIHPDLRQIYEKTLADLNEYSVNMPDNCHSVTEVIRALFLLQTFSIAKEKGLVGLARGIFPFWLVQFQGSGWVLTRS